MTKLLSRAVAIASAVLHAANAEEIYEVHGSGTTNPSKCFWSIMSAFEARSKVPVRLTYRAVGSTTGIEEFIGNEDTTTVPITYKPINDFGSGDIPLDADKYGKANGMVHLPFLIGGVSFFHNIPYVDVDGIGGLNLTGCLLARIFDREIINWNHEDILDLNPNMKLPDEGLDITVARRVKGSSSTKSVTGYLNKKCPEHWTLGEGSTVDWSFDTEECQGSGGMTQCIRDKEGAIGYIDAGHGWDEGLKEVRLEINGNFKTSEELDALGGFAAAADSAALSTMPSNYEGDFSEVNLINQPGDNTWPIVVMSYVYVRKNLFEFMENDKERGLLKLFLESLYDEAYIGTCTEHGFSMVPEKVKEKALEAIKETVNFDDAHEWSFEYKKTTRVKEGHGDYVISGKRRSFFEYELSRNEDDIQKLHEELLELRDMKRFTNAQQKRLDAAFALSIISMCIWGLTLAWFVKRMLMPAKHSYTMSDVNVPESS